MLGNANIVSARKRSSSFVGRAPVYGICNNLCSLPNWAAVYSTNVFIAAWAKGVRFSKPSTIKAMPNCVAMPIERNFSLYSCGPTTG